jgi:tripartite-type tricarboxylate transporter receptor subunit TctC
MRILLHAVAFASTLANVGSAAAQVYPSRPITMVVPFAAGGGNDVVARILAERMKAALGQPIIVENVPGAAGSIGVGRAVRASADGYTPSIGSLTSHVLVGGLYTLP